MGQWMQTAAAKVQGIMALLMYLPRGMDWYAYTAALGEPPAAIMEKP